MLGHEVTDMVLHERQASAAETTAWVGTHGRRSQGKLLDASYSMLHCQCECLTCTLLFMKRMTMPSSSNMVATCSHSK